MDKPISMPVKDYLVKIMSIRMNIPSATIDAIITHQFEEANKALLTNNSVELAGFGKFLFKLKKANKKLEWYYQKKDFFQAKFNEEGITEAKKISWGNKLNNTIKEIEALITKLNGSRKDMGGVEKQPSSSEGIEISHPTDSRLSSDDL